MSTSSPSPASPELTRALDAETAARNAWIIAKIAQHLYEPLPPPAAWAGREELIAAFGAHFKLEDPCVCAAAVDAAVGELLLAGEGDRDVSVQTKLMLLRLKSLRQLVLQYIERGRSETTYKYEHTPDPNDPTKTKFVEMRLRAKKKVERGVDMAAIQQLRGIEDQIARLEGLIDAKGPTVNVVQAIFEELDRRGSEAGAEEDDPALAVSPAARARRRSLNDPRRRSSGAALARVADAVAQINAPPAPPKQIESRVIPPENGAEPEKGGAQ